MLDTGSEVTLTPGYLARERRKRTVASQIRAANGTLIEVLGVVQLTISLTGREMIAEGVASDHIAEMFLGSIDSRHRQPIWICGMASYYA